MKRARNRPFWVTAFAIYCEYWVQSSIRTGPSGVDVGHFSIEGPR